MEPILMVDIGGVNIPVSIAFDEASAKNMETVAAESFTKIIESASKGDFTGLATQLGGPVAGAFAEATKSALEFVKGQAEAVERLDDLAKAAGTSYSAMQGLEAAFAAGGVGAAGFERSMAHMAQTVNQAWTEIQQNARTAGTQEESAQLGMQRAALASEEAYRNLSKTMADVASQAKHDAQGIVDAQLSLRRAQLNQAKGQGADVSGAEESLKQQENANSVVKAQQAVSDAFRKSAEDAAAANDKIAEAQLRVQEASIRTAEAAEKAHQAQLKDVGTIASEIERVATSTGKWSDSNLLLETSAKTATEAIIKMASSNGMKPDTEAVLMKTAEIFKGLGNDAESSAAKIEIVQRLMGAGFRSMGASAEQLVSILAKGPEALKAWEAEMTAFNQSSIGVKSSDVQALQEFTSAWATLGTYIQSAAQHIAGLSAGGFTSMFNAAKESISETDGILHKFMEAIDSCVEIVGSLGSAIADVWHVIQPVVSAMVEIFAGLLKAVSGVAEAIEMLVKSFTSLSDGSELIHGIEVVMLALAAALTDAGFAAEMAVAQFAKLLLIVTTVTKAMSELVQLFAAGAKAMGAGEWADKLGALAQKVEQSANAMIRAATAGQSDKWGIVGTDKTAFGEQDPNSTQNKETKVNVKVDVALRRDGGAAASGTSGTSATGSGSTATPGTTAALPGYTEAERAAINKKIQDAPASATGIQGNLDRMYNPEKVPPGSQGSDGYEWERKYPSGPPTPPTESEKAADLKHRYDYKNSDGSPDQWMQGRHLDGTQSYTGPQAKDAPEIAELKAAIEKMQKTPGMDAATTGQMYDKQNRLRDLEKGDYVPGSGTPVQYSAGIQAQQQKYDDWMKNHPGSDPNNQNTWGPNAGTGAPAMGADNGSALANASSAAGDALGTIKQNAADAGAALDTIPDKIREAFSFQGLIESVGQLVSAVKSAAETLGDGKTPHTDNTGGGTTSGGGQSSGFPGMSGGGRVRGPGGPRDDLAGLYRLSSGEHVMQAAAVDHYGQPFMDMVNAMMYPGMAAGGPVAPRPAIAAAGATSTVNLTIDGNKFNGMKAPENVARSLKQYAVTRQSASAGKAPSWMQ